MTRHTNLFRNGGMILAAALALLPAALASGAEPAYEGWELAYITSEEKVVVLDVSDEGAGADLTVELPEGEPDRLIASPKGRKIAMLFRDAN